MKTYYRVLNADEQIDPADEFFCRDGGWRRVNCAGKWARSFSAPIRRVISKRFVSTIVAYMITLPPRPTKEEPIRTPEMQAALDKTLGYVEKSIKEMDSGLIDPALIVKDADLQTRDGKRVRIYAVDGCKYGPGTTRQIAERSGLSLLTLRPRTTELYDLGFILLDGASRGTEGVYRALSDEEARGLFEAHRELLQAQDARQPALF